MTDSDVAALVAAAWTGDRSWLPTDLMADGDLSTGYSCQDAVVALLVERGWSVGGYKLGLTDAAAQRARGLEAPLVGRIMRAPYGSVVLGSDTLCEPEIAFRWSNDSAAGNIGSIHLAVELAGTRYRSWPDRVPALVADNVGSLGFVLGPPGTPVSSDLLTDSPLIWTIGGAPVVLAEQLNTGLVRQAARTIAEWADARGVVLCAGDVILTGALAAPTPWTPGDAFELTNADLGQIDAGRSGHAGR